MFPSGQDRSIMQIAEAEAMAPSGEGRPAAGQA